MILHLLGMRTNVTRNVFNARKGRGGGLEEGGHVSVSLTMSVSLSV